MSRPHFLNPDTLKSRLAEIFAGFMLFDVIISNPPFQLCNDEIASIESMVRPMPVGDQPNAEVNDE